MIILSSFRSVNAKQPTLTFENRTDPHSPNLNLGTFFTMSTQMLVDTSEFQQLEGEEHHDIFVEIDRIQELGVNVTVSSCS